MTARNGIAGHACPEVYIGTTQAEFDQAAAYIRQCHHASDGACHVTRKETGPRYWFKLDCWRRYPGGEIFADDGVRVAYYPDGLWEQVES